MRWFFLIVMFFFHLTCALGWAEEPVSLAELLGNARKFHGERILFEGELIGSSLDRGEFAWLNLGDATGALGVWVKDSLLPAGLRGGHYAWRGDVVIVDGIFSRVCSEHAGTTDLHALSLEVVSRGRALVEEVDRRRIAAAFLLSGVLICLLILREWRRKRARR